MNKEEDEKNLSYLKSELEQEAKSRRLQEDLNVKLQDEYDVLLKKLAEAELHIDQLRLGASVDIKKRFILTHETHSNLTKSVRENQHRPMWGSSIPRGGQEGVLAGHVMVPTKKGRNQLLDKKHAVSHEESSITSNQHMALSEHQTVSSSNEPHESLLRVEQEFMPLQNNHQFTSTKDDTIKLAHQSLSDVTSDPFSQRSTRRRATAESQHLAQIFCIRSLQEEISSLKDKIKTNNKFSVGEISGTLESILQQHENLTKDIGACSEKISVEVDSCREAMENEVYYYYSGNSGNGLILSIL